MDLILVMLYVEMYMQEKAFTFVSCMPYIQQLVFSFREAEGMHSKCV